MNIKDLEFWGTLIVGILSGSFATFFTMATYDQAIIGTFVLIGLVVFILLLPIIIRFFTLFKH